METSWCDGVVAGQEPSLAPPVPPCVASLEGEDKEKEVYLNMENVDDRPPGQSDRHGVGQEEKE